MKVKTIKLKPIMSVEESDKMAGVLLSQDACKTLIDYDCDVYDAESGKCIAKFRKKVIPANIQLAAFNSLLIAAKTSMNRGTSGGKIDGKAADHKIRSNGKLSKTSEASNPVDSGIVGFFDRNPRMPFCRLTAFNQQHFEKFKKAYPIIKFVDRTYAQLMPQEYKKQRVIADTTSQDFVIKDTAFTTITVNKNWQTAVHKDKGDFAEGFGNLVALRKGKYLGGHFVVVRWGVGFDLQNGDLLLVDVHQWHGNTPIIKDNGKVVRLSLVMYYREAMKDCGTMAQELHRAKTRKKGEPVKGNMATLIKNGKLTKHGKDIQKELEAKYSKNKNNHSTSTVKRRRLDKKDIRKK
jgi:uncharacterized protein YdbL (DUF1318 family)